MKIFDMHIHATKKEPNPEALLASMSEAGVFGGAVISGPPAEQNMAEEYGASTYEERIAELRAWCQGYEDRIFPVLWIHPNEENIMEIIHRAKADGVKAFKMICSDYFVYDERPMAVIREIAKTGLPIIFHTGILWDGNVSSKYNRPINWEALLDVDGIRFSLAHCSWPWIDECVALYGKFLNARTVGKHVEMFFDTTPGTPEIYRRELLTKLYTIGYDVGDNIMFGLDSYANSWKSEWAKKWLAIDGEILDSLGVSLAYREKLYYHNLLRFLGIEKTVLEIAVPETDDSHAWSAVSPEVSLIVEKWYKRLGFSSYCDKEFYEALATVKISDAITLEGYDKSSKDGKRNLLSYLFLCEATERKCKALGIPDEIVTDTLSDIVTWCNTWTAFKGTLYLGELSWLARHLGARLFKLGRLQFCMAEAEHDIPKYGIKKGDNVVEVHIPEGKGLTVSDCEDSLCKARAFFAKYFPEYEYSVFTCHSWLLDDTLKNYLSEGSGILAFAQMFDKIAADESLALVRYLFPWDTTPLNLRQRYPMSSLAAKVQKAVLKGEKFYEVLGVIEK